MGETRKMLAALLALGLGLLGCGHSTDPGGEPPIPNARRILFIGNSFTYYNALPELVKELAWKVGTRDLHIESVTMPGVSLEDHWLEGRARRKLADTTWDLVIMQQGPSSQPDGRALLLEYAHRFNTEIRAAGGRPAFYMVWPDISRPGDFDGVSANYRAAADSTDGMLFPGGEAWRAVWRRDPRIELYSKDGLHPTPLGSYVVALTIVGQISGQPIVGMPAVISIDGDAGAYEIRLSPGVARLVQEAAAEAVEQFGRM